MRETLRIGELSRASGRSVHTIRWYERQGLIPDVDRDRGGRRTYRAAHIEWLAFLDRLRVSGMSVRQMRDYAVLVRLGHASLEARLALLGAHREQVVARITALNQALRIIDAKIGYYREWHDNRRRPVIMPSARAG